ncbi:MULTISPECIES: carboxyl transferase domain-containing protein [unclassified Pseudobutyrivibrio]|uniref:carboxyl transferase domain-containing protein n=1 Tax=unclassified Pseudobutyrivibrio TaxID=2638619 RepID=UPI0005D17AC9|nr:MULTISPECIES: carboxyl transferase domain-containing protein [unclassified Pseudobutyrivibrio]SES68847.1 Acetyl-CoA carboxylase, carboxyltransferase component [Pseudobutyrivibrio sp. C4]
MGNDLSQAQARINALLDDNSFVELQSLVTSRNTDFNLDAKKEPSDGVIIGHGLVDGTLVFVFSQNADVLGGTIGEMHAKKILSVYDMALKVGAPVIGFIDCGGVRLQESFDALEALGSVIERAADVKGVIPQLICVAGNCGGGLSVLPALADFTFMVDGAKLFINSPDTISGNSSDKCDTSSATFQFEEAGTVDMHGSLAEVVSSMRQVISMIPNDIVEASDDLNRAAEGLEGKLTDAAAVATELADNRQFVELKAGFAKEMVTGLIKLDGVTIGVVGNREVDGEAVLSAAGCEKAADFVDLCDMYEIPVLSITNVAAFKSCTCQEKRLPRALSQMTQRFVDASVPKINLITKQGYGTPYVLMNSKSLGADLVYAFDSTSVGAMEASKAAKILADNGTDAAAIEKDYAELQDSALTAAAHGHIDRIVSMADARKYIIAGFEMFF